MSEPTAPELSLARYTILERIGEGGMASVYLARREGSAEPVIIKVLHQHMADNEVVAHRFLREAQVAATLDHPNIATLSDAGRDGSVFYIAMEHISGQELERVMHQHIRERRRMPPGVVLTISADVLAALDYAHGFQDSDGTHLRIVHRDLSPRNVLVGFDGIAKVIDFGLVRTNLGDFRTAPGMVMGTLRYMSPEQAVADPVDHRSDIYTWGVVLWEALTGHLLIPNGKAADILKEVITKVPAGVSTLNPELPAALDPVLAKALEKRREDRFDTAAEMAAAIAEAAPELVKHPRAELGAYFAGVFPGEADVVEERLQRARLANLDVEHTVVRDAPEWELTRAGPALALADPAPVVDARTNVFDPADTVDSEHFEPTAYAPAGLATNDISFSTSQQEVKPRRSVKPVILGALTVTAVALGTMVVMMDPKPTQPLQETVAQLPPDRPAPGVAARATAREPAVPAKAAPVKAPPTRVRTKQVSKSPPARRTKVATPPPAKPARGAGLKKAYAEVRVAVLAKDLPGSVLLMKKAARRMGAKDRTELSNCLARANAAAKSLSGEYRAGDVESCVGILKAKAGAQ